MTISMTPTGQPYGKRKQNVAAAQDAGLSQRVAQSPPPSLPSVPRQAVQAPAFVPGESYDAFAEAQPATSQGMLRQRQGSPLVDSLLMSPSPALRDIARRLRGI